MIPIDLSGKTALITGAGQGIGRATATLLHRAGATLAVNEFDDAAGTNRGRADETVAALGSRAFVVLADVRNRPQVDAMIEEVMNRSGRLDIVVNNAGIIRDRSLKNLSAEDWQQVIDTNLTGVLHVCQAAASVLPEGARIVNMASISGVVGFFGQANYAAAKAGVIGLTKVLSKELARRRITVNAIAPGVVLTQMGLSIPANAREEMLRQIPLGRFGEPEEIAGPILWLCSDLASYVTGQTIHVSGGWV